MSRVSDKSKTVFSQSIKILAFVIVLWLEKRFYWPESPILPYRLLAYIHWPVVFGFIFLALLFLFIKHRPLRPTAEPTPALRLYLLLLHFVSLWFFTRYHFGWMLIAGILSMAMAIFRRRDLKYLAFPAILSFLIALAIYYSTLFFKWLYELPVSVPVLAMIGLNRLSYLIAWLVKWGLAPLGYTASLDFMTSPAAPIITVGKLSIQISLACSGIESMFLFSAFFLLVVFLQRKKIALNKAVIAFMLGLAIQFLINALRVLIAVLISLRCGYDKAFDIFHDNISWVIFILYFFVFWSIAFPRIRKGATH